jgi:hypothetical protein
MTVSIMNIKRLKTNILFASILQEYNCPIMVTEPTSTKFQLGWQLPNYISVHFFVIFNLKKVGKHLSSLLITCDKTHGGVVHKLRKTKRVKKVLASYTGPNGLGMKILRAGRLIISSKLQWQILF